MNNFGAGLVAIIAAVIGLAIIAVLVSRNAQTPAVFRSAGGALASIIGAAVAPVTGANSFGTAPTIGSL